MRTWQPHITALNKSFQFITYNLSRVFSSKYNPMYYFGAITIYLLIIDSISGLYLLAVYKIDPRFSFMSVEAISSGFVGNLMRGIHRYSSDALIVTAVGHMIHVIITDKYRMFRWIAWVSGVATILLFLAIGLSGYVLVWDEKAQLLSLLTAKFLTFLPLFGDALMSTILSSDIKNLGGMFRVLLFGHIALTLAIIFTLWIHVLRISRPKLMPPGYLYITVTIGLALFAILFPAASDPEANISKIPFGMTMDWFYMFGYPLVKVIPMSYNWLIVIGTFLLLIILPWIIRGERNPHAHIDLDKCVGCEQCYIDCPFRAIVMRNVDDQKKALLSEEKCSGCGTCVGSCSALAVDIPSFNIEDVISTVKEKAPEIVAIRCGYSAVPQPADGLLVFDAPCVSVVNTRFAERILETGVKGLIMLACETRDCHFREGNIWTDERYLRKRAPRLRKKTDHSRIRILHAPNYKDVSQELDEFRNDIRSEKSADEVEVKSLTRVNYVFASLLLCLPLITLYPLTTHKVSFYSEEKSIIAMSFKYRSSTVKRTAAQRADKTGYKGERSPIKIEVVMNGSSIYSKSFYPRGLRGDAAVFVYDEILLDPERRDITITLTEIDAPDRRIELKIKRDLVAKDTLYISYDDVNRKLTAL